MDLAPACALTGLLLLALGIGVGGAPFRRAGKPSLWRIAALFVAGAAGLVLMATLGLVIVIGVVGVSCAIVALSLLRWPPGEWLARPVRVRRTRPPLGGIVATLGTLFSFFGALMVAAEATDPDILVMVLLMIVMLAVWMRLAFLYAGR